MTPEEISIPQIEKILKATPLDSRLRVSLWFSIVNFITEAGYREDKMWGDDESELL